MNASTHELIRSEALRCLRQYLATRLLGYLRAGLRRCIVLDMHVPHNARFGVALAVQDLIDQLAEKADLTRYGLADDVDEDDDCDLALHLSPAELRRLAARKGT